MTEELGQKPPPQLNKPQQVWNLPLAARISGPFAGLTIYFAAITAGSHANGLTHNLAGASLTIFTAILTFNVAAKAMETPVGQNLVIDLPPSLKKALAKMRITTLIREEQPAASPEEP
jgi:hypothetical protein